VHQRARLSSDRTRIEVGVVFALTALLAVGLIGGLIAVAGPWAVAANTRLLDLLYRAGVVRLTDADQGYWEGAPSHEYFIKSQDWVDWGMVGLAAVMLIAVWALRSVRFHSLASGVGFEGTIRRHVRLYLYGEEMGRYLPYDLGTAVTLAPLAEDEDDQRVGRLASLVTLVRVGEVLFFGLVTAFLVGFATWFSSMLWALIVLAAAAYLVYGRVRNPRARIRSGFEYIRRTLSMVVFEPSRWIGIILITLITFPLEEAVAYLIVQSFTSEHVVLGGATPSVLLLALVAGKMAQLVRATPGGIGQFELAFAASLVASGQGVAEAVTITLLFSLIRHLTGAVVLGVTSIGGGAGTSAGEAVRWTAAPDAPDAIQLPSPGMLGRRLLTLGSVIVGFILLNRVRLLLVDYWLFESLGFEEVFWTNFWLGAVLFAIGGLLWASAIILPAVAAGVTEAARRTTMHAGVIAGILGGAWWASHYQTFLLAFNGVPFEEVDPVFGHDLAFYAFRLPAWETALAGLAVVSTAALLSSILWRYALTRPVPGSGVLTRLFVACHDPFTIVLLGTTALTWAGRVWLYQFDVLIADNYESSIGNGAEALDVSGFLSTVNGIRAESLIVLGLAVSTMVLLVRSKRGNVEPRTAMWILGPWLVLAIAFPTAVGVRDVLAIRPNEPVIQLEYIGRHIEATNKAWGMDQVEPIDFTPNGSDDPLPALDRLLTHPSMLNAQLWPGATSWLEQLLDPQHVERILLEADSRYPDMVFGASLDIFKQQQKLRAYYDFLDVDVARYEVDGQPTLVASSVRELPLLEPHPWLAYWGQRFVLFTHGHGLVVAPLGQIGPDGGPTYLSSGIPTVASDPALDPGQQSIYYGEGSGNIGFSNIDGVPELDYPTEQGREDVVLPADLDAGVRIDSLLKRLMFAWGTTEPFNAGSFFDVTFSGLIDSDTRIHYERQPLDRIKAVAPFLFLDADPYAVVGPQSIQWMVNGMTVTDRYPYSKLSDLGDKSIRRVPFPTDVEWVNYAADSVKVTVDAYTGQTAFYQISDEPVVSSWAAVYPTLFRPESEMPAEIAAHKQFPTQLFHSQFDDLYIYYHVTDPLAFFNQEDLFDDADEVLGPMLQSGRGITFSMEPYPAIVETGTDFAASQSPTQFGLNQIFTPEGALNLRSIVTVYQEGDDYGKLSMLQVPKGHFAHGPAQAEAVIDQDNVIAQQFGFWNTTGVEVLRGYMTPVVIDGELIYIEPVFIRSAQNPFPQLSRVVVVMRGMAAMAPTLEEAVVEAWGRVSGDGGG
jgi:uncharacterized protein